MRNFRRDIPPLRSLVAFEAAARNLGFTKAANELGVTQVAMSRQIKALEAFVGTRLFERLHRSVRLTSEGEKFQGVVTSGLSQIADVVVDFQNGNTSKSLVVGTTTAFSANWLMPRISRFYAAREDADIRFAVNDKCEELKASGIHLSIRYGEGDWPGVAATHLCDSDVIPLCSRSYWKDRPQISDPRALMDEFLIDFDYVIDSRWSSWFNNLGIVPEKSPAKLSIDSYTSMVQATLNGQGIALLGSPLVDELVASEALVSPTTLPRQKLAGGYYIVTPQKSEPRHALDNFQHWVMQEMIGSDQN
jgi:LysR family glycine cleavage system transcriptional activator